MANLFSRSPREQAEIAIDLGTARTRVIARGGGVQFDQPSLCCFADDGVRSKLIAAGDDASRMKDRTSGVLQVRHPLARGVLQDLEAACELLKFAMNSSIGRRRFAAPDTLIGVPADATKAECGALYSAAADAGLRKVRLVREPLAAAFGAGLPVEEPTGSFILECGAGTTEAAIFSLGGFCLTRSVRGGGAALDASISAFLHKQHQFLIGDLTAERLKKQLAELLASGGDGQTSVQIKGRNLRSGKPGTLILDADAFRAVMTQHARGIAQLVRVMLSETPPQLSYDICESGIVLTGGSAFDFIAETVSSETGLNAVIADQNDHCVSRGLAAMLN